MIAITFWSFPSSALSGWGDRLGPQHSVGAVFILGYHVGKWNFLAGGRHAPNHLADPLRGTSRHHYLGGGLDEQPTLKLIP